MWAPHVKFGETLNLGENYRKFEWNSHDLSRTNERRLGILPSKMEVDTGFLIYDGNETQNWIGHWSSVKNEDFMTKPVGIKSCRAWTCLDEMFAGFLIGFGVRFQDFKCWALWEIHKPQNHPHGINPQIVPGFSILCILSSYKDEDEKLTDNWYFMMVKHHSFQWICNFYGYHILDLPRSYCWLHVILYSNMVLYFRWCLTSVFVG